jgi:hypothetical protein
MSGVDAVPVELNGTVMTPTAPAVPVADDLQKASSTPTTAKPKAQSTTKAVVAVDAEGPTAVSELEVPSGTSASATESASSNSDKKADRVSGAGGQPYFESASFWFHAAGTLTIAMVVGFQLV